MNGSQSQLWMNVAPVTVPDVDITTEVLPFDYESLRSMRRDYCGRYLFKRGREERDGGAFEDIIHAVRLIEGSRPWEGNLDPLAFKVTCLWLQR